MGGSSEDIIGVLENLKNEGSVTLRQMRSENGKQLPWTAHQGNKPLAADTTEVSTSLPVITMITVVSVIALHLKV